MKKHKRTNYLAKDLLAQMLTKLGRVFPANQRCMMSYRVDAFRDIEVSTLRTAFSILERYFRMRYKRVKLEEYRIERYVVFIISFYTPRTFVARLPYPEFLTVKGNLFEIVQ